MKNFINILLMLHVPLASFSQYIPLPLDSAVWHYSFTEWPNLTYQVNYLTTGDTVINNKTYKVITDDYNESAIIREDSLKRVYLRYLNLSGYSCLDTNEILTYNFNLNINDTFIVKNCHNDTSVCILDIKDSVLTSAGYRDRYIFSCSTNWVSGYMNPEMTWIEGIGQTNDLLYSSWIGWPGPGTFDFNFLSLDTYGTSIYIIPNSLPNLEVSHNLIWVENGNIIHSNSEIEKLEIYNLLGKLIWSPNVQGTFYIKTPYEIYFNGIYILRIQFKNGDNQTSLQHLYNIY